MSGAGGRGSDARGVGGPEAGGPEAGGRPALFVDRDGTIIRERRYLSDPRGVELLPGAVEGLRAFQSAGYALIIVTNQSGIARGLYPEEAYRRVEREVEDRLASHRVHVDGSYHCPHHPDFTGPCDCRKPATGLFLRAAEEHGLDPARSVFVGDRLRDAEPALRLGGLGVVVRTGYGAGATELGASGNGLPNGIRVADDLRAAAVIAGVV